MPCTHQPGTPVVMLYITIVQYKIQDSGIYTTCGRISVILSHVPISCNSYCNQDTALLHLHKDFPHSIPAESSTTTTTSLTLPNPANNSLVSISVIFSFQEYYINEIKHHMTFSNGLFSVSIMPLRSIQISIFQLLLISEEYSMLWVYCGTKLGFAHLCTVKPIHWHWVLPRQSVFIEGHQARSPGSWCSKGQKSLMAFREKLLKTGWGRVLHGAWSARGHHLVSQHHRWLIVPTSLGSRCLWSECS